MKKQLNVSEEKFFELLYKKYGVPDHNARQFILRPHDPFNRGLTAYFKHDPRGKVFIECLVECGEAKLRAPRWFRRYEIWYPVKFMQRKK